MSKMYPKMTKIFVLFVEPSSMLESVGYPGEGQTVTYTCVSQPARPPLKLKMQIYPDPPEYLKAKKMIHDPLLNKITDLSPIERITISWTFPFTLTDLVML